MKPAVFARYEAHDPVLQPFEGRGSYWEIGVRFFDSSGALQLKEIVRVSDLPKAPTFIASTYYWFLRRSGLSVPSNMARLFIYQSRNKREALEKSRSFFLSRDSHGSCALREIHKLTYGNFGPRV